jgi:hypothetical protein
LLPPPQKKGIDFYRAVNINTSGNKMIQCCSDYSIVHGLIPLNKSLFSEKFLGVDIKGTDHLPTLSFLVMASLYRFIQMNFGPLRIFKRVSTMI